MQRFTVFSDFRYRSVVFLTGPQLALLLLVELGEERGSAGEESGRAHLVMVGMGPSLASVWAGLPRPRPPVRHHPRLLDLLPPRHQTCELRSCKEGKLSADQDHSSSQPSPPKPGFEESDMYQLKACPINLLYHRMRDWLSLYRAWPMLH